MKTENGNMLWLILVSIALLGAITAMFARSSSSTDETGEYERNTIEASEIMRYAKSLELAVQALQARGCSENELSFWYDSDSNGTENGSDDYYNDDAPEDHSCHIFDQYGGGLVYEDGWSFTGDSRVLDVGDNDKAELLALTQTNKDTCMQINTQMGIANAASDAPPENFLTGDFTGSYGTSTAANATSGDTSAQLAGTHQHCIKNGAGEYVFLQALLAR